MRDNFRQLAIDLLYRDMILVMGTSCQPSITRLAIRDALMVGEAVQAKNSLTKKPNETQRTQYYCTNIHKKRSPVWNSL